MISLRYLNPETTVDRSIIEQLIEWLEKDESMRLGRIKQHQARHNYLISHALLRAVLAQELHCHPSRIRFGKTESGKPVLSQPEQPELHFNLSHTHGLVAVALGHQPVGVDVEWLHRRRLELNIAHRFFTERECADIFDQPQDQRKKRFLVYWTLKEALLKATGEGIAKGITKAEFRLRREGIDPQLGIEMTWLDRDNRHDSGGGKLWSFIHENVTGSHLMSLAYRGKLPQATEIDIRPWQPDDWPL